MAPIIIPRIVTNAFVRYHPELIFIHGYDVQKKGCFGHAAILGHPNTFPIPTMYKFCASGARYFTDGDTTALQHIADALDAIPDDGRPIIPLRKIGEGCSRMRELAPLMWKSLKNSLEMIEYPEIVWDYLA